MNGLCSIPLSLSLSSRLFLPFFESEAAALNDTSLAQEVDIMERVLAS